MPAYDPHATSGGRELNDEMLRFFTYVSAPPEGGVVIDEQTIGTSERPDVEYDALTGWPARPTATSVQWINRVNNTPPGEGGVGYQPTDLVLLATSDT